MTSPKRNVRAGHENIIAPVSNGLIQFGLCSNCSQKLDECSLARARKIFASARMLGFSLKFPAL